VQAEPGEARRLKAQLRAAARARLARDLPLPEGTPTSVLTDLLLQTLQAPPAVVEDIFAEPEVAARARKALAAHARYPRAPNADDVPED